MIVALLALFSLSLPTATLSHGFTADTPVCTYEGAFIPISDITSKTKIAGYTSHLDAFAPGVIKKTETSIADTIIIINTETQVIHTTPTQWFLCQLPNGNVMWRPAHLLTEDDMLCTIHGPIPIWDIEVCYGTITMHTLTTVPDHAFFITEDCIIVHNTGGEIGALFLNTHYSSVLMLETAAVSPWAVAFGCAAGACFAIYGIYRGIKWCVDKYRQHRSRSILRSPPQAIPRGKTDGKDIVDTDNGKPGDDKPRKIVRIYDDAGYHHFQSRGRKSPCPIDGKAALRVSIPIKVTSSQRIGTSMGQIVRLYRDSCRELPTHTEEKYHGFVVSWEEIGKLKNGNLIQKLLVDSGLTTIRGIALL